MKKEVRLLKRKAFASLCFSIDRFNALSDVGRTDAVLMFLDHSFEMLLKAAILHRGGPIRHRGEAQTMSLRECVRKGLSDADVKFLTDDQALMLQTVNGLRGSAHHHLLDISEAQLYMHAQGGVTLFRGITKHVFKEELTQQLPARVLPVSTVAPADIDVLFATEVGEIKKLLAPGRRKQTEAYSRLRPLAIVDSNIRGEDLEPSDATLRKLGRRLLTGESWEQVFPGAAAVRIETAGEGPSISFRLTKKEGVPVQLVPEGTPGAAVVAVRRVDELSFYNLGHKQLADRLGITAPKLTALVEVYGLRNDPDYFKLFRIGQSSFGRYSQLAMGRIEEILRETTLEDVWRRYQEQR